MKYLLRWWGYGRQDPPVPTSLNDLKLPPNAINITATKAAVQPTALQCKQRNSPQSPVPSKLSSISAPPMMMIMSAVEPSETTSAEGTFYSEVKPRSFILLSSPCPPQPPRKQKRKLSIGMSFCKRWRLSQHFSEACRQVLPEKKDIPGPSTD